MKILLCIPPNYCFDYDLPLLGTPMIAGFLKGKGVEVIQSDLNMEYLHYFVGKTLGENRCLNLTTTDLRAIFIKEVNRQYDIKRSKNYYYSALLKPPDYHCNSFEDSTNSSFYFTERLLSSEHLARYIDDEKENTFLKFFQDKGILKRIEDEKIDIVGISIIAPSQVIAALTLGRMIKKNLDNVHVTLGGQWPTLFREEITARPDWRVFFDTIITFEGETPFYKLVKCLETKDDLSKVPNLIYFAKSRWIKSGAHSKENLNELACPDFDGLPLNKYAYAEDAGTCLVYQTARECYWNKCIYCSDLPLPKQGYRERHDELVIKDMQILAKKYGMKYLMTSNAVFSPVQMRRLSELLVKKRLGFKWGTFARMDKGFTRQTLASAVAAGCDYMLFGLESGNQRVLDFIKKGVNIGTASEIIKNCYDVGIKVGLQMILGLPSETIEEAFDTVKFLVDNDKYIKAGATFNIYFATPACNVYLNPSKYGIKIKKDPALPFQFFHDYSHTTGGMSSKKAKGLLAAYGALLKKFRVRNVQSSPPL